MSTNNDRIIVLDTETTGMNREGGAHYEGHRIIEIGAVEIINRKLTGRHFHRYIKPDRLVDPEAIAVHGITDEFLVDKPSYHEIHKDFVEFIQGAELVAHNAPFDVGFINHEFHLLDVNLANVESFCQITDTLAMARRLFPGKRNNLDVLCERYGIDNSHRSLHGALLDAEILADVYLLMTGGQTSLSLEHSDDNRFDNSVLQAANSKVQRNLRIISATESELIEHETRLDAIAKKGACLWRNGSSH